MSYTDDMSHFIKEIKQEKIILKELNNYLSEHEKHSEEILDSMSQSLRARVGVNFLQDYGL